MAKLGKYNLLKVVKHVDFGVYLDGGKDGEILLPSRYVPEDCEPGSRIEVFVYLDSEDRLVATTEMPLAQVGEFAYLRVVAVTGTGAFLDWGLPKDLLVPFREQNGRMREGDSYVVYVYVDEDTRRMAASARLEKFIDKGEPPFNPGDPVHLLVARETDLGYQAIINNRFWGMLYKNEVFQLITVGQQMLGYIKQVREDQKIDLALQKPGFEKVEGIAEEILDKLKKAGGFLPVTDKTPAEEIYARFGISKKNYKKAIGDLYKKRLITLHDEGIRFVGVED